MKIWKYPLWLLLGVAFGIVLDKAQVISIVRIRRMFAFVEPHMYLVIGSAVVTGLITTSLLKLWRKKDIGGEEFKIKPRPVRFGVAAGGLLFGIGWYLTNACPGPIYVLIGSGQWPALAILAGALVGALVFSLVKPRLKE